MVAGHSQQYGSLAAVLLQKCLSPFLMLQKFFEVSVSVNCKIIICFFLISPFFVLTLCNRLNTLFYSQSPFMFLYSWFFILSTKIHVFCQSFYMVRHLWVVDTLFVSVPQFLDWIKCIENIYLYFPLLENPCLFIPFSFFTIVYALKTYVVSS